MICVNLMTKSLRHTLAVRRYRERHPEQCRAQVASYRKSEKFKATMRKHAELRKRDGRARAAQLKYLYGITVEQYDAMLESQNGSCAICKNPPKDGKKLGVDHCHASGEVRGLLCDDCNTGLGKFQDSPDLLNAAREYVGIYPLCDVVR